MNIANIPEREIGSSILDSAVIPGAKLICFKPPLVNDDVAILGSLQSGNPRGYSFRARAIPAELLDPKIKKRSRLHSHDCEPSGFAGSRTDGLGVASPSRWLCGRGNRLQVFHCAQRRTLDAGAAQHSLWDHLCLHDGTCETVRANCSGNELWPSTK